MNKKIKIIELLNIIAQFEGIEKLPKKIKYYDYIYELQIASRDYYCKTEDDYLTDRVDDKPLNSFLNDTVEILEDNTEEIEELEKEQEAIANPRTMMQEIRFYYDSNKMGDKINEIIRYIKRKDKNND